MKIVKYLLASALLSVVVLISCDTDGGTSKPKLITGTVANIRKDANLSQKLNYIDIQKDIPTKFGITIDKTFQSEFVSADIIGFYKKGTKIEKKVLKSNLNNFPATLTLTSTDLIDLFDMLNSKGDLFYTDELILTADLIKADGTRVKLFNDNGTQYYGSSLNNIAATSNFVKYVFECPIPDASMYNGNYAVVTDEWKDYVKDSVVPLSYNPADGTMKFKILSTNNDSVINKDSYLLVTVKSDGKCTVVSNANFNYGVTEIYSASGTGEVSGCTGDIKLLISWKNITTGVISGPVKFDLKKS
ncbi:hypothetical protein FLACOL_00415 [Flavobacterium columnare]|uniref:Lipoprotein n=2 Tax=Flavobacterium TaxID=237 RepID=A0ABW8PME6_9FLAO|nr:hypothetical protein [Flavobacterium columnare]SPE76435.1 hypothetical protein FLACOL_00415 [Flavobacterium columnare]